MALMAGKDAYMVWDQAASNLNIQYGQNWNCTVSRTVVEITSMQDSWRTYHTGHQDWTATVIGLLPFTAGSPDKGTDIVIGGDDGMGDDECRLTLYFNYDTGTPTYQAVYGTAICTGISISTPAEDMCIVTYAFQGVDQLQWYSGATVPA